MGHEIPEPFVWDESFKVFYDHLDSQHRGLFQAIFDVGKSPSDTHSLSTLVNLMQEHFDHEEHDMKKANFDGLDHHKHAHDEFLKSLRAVSTPVPSDKVTWAKEWLVNHIKAIDSLYSGKL